MDELSLRPDCRAVPHVLKRTPVTFGFAPMFWPPSETLATLQNAFDDGPVFLQRTPEGRALGKARYHRAMEFMPGLPRAGLDRSIFIYSAGITAQLGLSAHLLDVGFPDSWCAHHIGHRVARSLAYANATGLDHSCPDMARLADVLNPYWIWNVPRLSGEPAPEDGGFEPDTVHSLLSTLLDHVRQVTGLGSPSAKSVWRSRSVARL